jgi:hypothetical protein
MRIMVSKWVDTFLCGWLKEQMCGLLSGLVTGCTVWIRLENMQTDEWVGWVGEKDGRL